MQSPFSEERMAPSSAASFGQLRAGNLDFYRLTKEYNNNRQTERNGTNAGTNAV